MSGRIPHQQEIMDGLYMNDSLEQVSRANAAGEERVELRHSEAVDALRRFGGRLTTSEAANVLNRTPRRIRAMINEGSLLGILHGRDYLISAGEVQKILDKRESKRQRAESINTEKRKVKSANESLGPAGRQHGAEGETKPAHRIESESHPDCPTCRRRIETGDFTGPVHTPSPACRSGKRPHCSCGFCF